MICDQLAQSTIENNRNMIVPWYLMATYSYEHLNDIILTDGYYDNLCIKLLEDWDNISHRHKYVIDKESLSASTGCGIPLKNYPTIVRSAAYHLLKKE